MQRDHSVPQPRLVHIKADYSPAVSNSEPSIDLRSTRIGEYLWRDRFLLKLRKLIVRICSICAGQTQHGLR